MHKLTQITTEHMNVICKICKSARSVETLKPTGFAFLRASHMFINVIMFNADELIAQS